MFFRSIFILLFFPLFLMGSSMDPAAHSSKKDTPSWVQLYGFPLEALPVKPSQVNLQRLLIDTQRNWEEKTLYRHFAIRALSQNGIEKVSQVEIDFDPSYTQVVMHTMRVFREGKWVDRLENTIPHMIQRETELDQSLYNGDLTLVYFLDDIREGDIVEYSYSLVGENPLSSSCYTDRVFLQRDFAVERIAHRLLCHPSLSFLIKPVSTSIEPQVRDLSPSLREWSWDCTNTLPYSYESGQPIWHDPPTHIEMSQYKSWKEVVKNLSPLYILPPDLAHSVSQEMGALIEKWKATAPTPSERALLALRFVQDQIRYLGIEEGMGAFRPTDPRLTFQRRYGDCKDKTFLLHALLHLMEIPSQPLLVHTRHGMRLPDVLPTPFAFNHLVLAIDVDSAPYYVDPTLSLQGGPLQTNYFPDYKWGLLLSDHTNELTQIPQTALKSPTEIASTLTLEAEDTAHLTVKTVFHDARADEWRRSFAWHGSKEMEESSLSALQKVYGSVTSLVPIEVLDDRENNTFTLTETYRVPAERPSDQNEIEIYSYTLREFLETRINPERASPCKISYPQWVKESICIQNPFIQWDKFEAKYEKEHESFFYTLSTRFKGNQATFALELKHLKDHIPKQSLRSYWRTVNEIYRNGPSRISVATLVKGPRFLSIASIATLCILPLIYFLTRKRLAAADWLVFWLKKFQLSYVMFNTFSLMVLFDKHEPLIFSFVVSFILSGIIYNRIYSKKSIRFILYLQALLILQGSLLFYVLISREGIPFLERGLGLLATSLCISSCFLILHKAKALFCPQKEELAR